MNSIMQGNFWIKGVHREFFYSLCTKKKRKKIWKKYIKTESSI